MTIAILSSETAQAITLEIDSLATMENNVNAFIPVANRLSNQRLNQFVLVSSTGGYAAVVIERGNSGVGWKQNDPNCKAGLGSSSAANLLNYNAPISFTFVDPNNPSNPFTTQAFSLYTDFHGAGGACAVRAFDINGVQVASDIKNEHVGIAAIGTQYSVTASAIHTVTFTGPGNAAISNIQYSQPVGAGGTISGVLNLSDYSASVAGQPVTFDLIQGGNIVETINGTLDATGNYSIVSHTVGTTTIRAKGSTWLAKNLGTYTLSNSALTGVNGSLVNGDAVDNNVVDLSDYTVVLIAFNALPSSSNWNPRADLNGDATVDLTDYTIIVSNFNQVGD